MTLRDEVKAKLRGELETVSVLSESPAIWLLNSYPANVRTASEKAGAKFWFDVTPELHERRQVEFFLYACGTPETIYVFPRINFEMFMRNASLGGQKQVPNFTIFEDSNLLEPAGHAHSKYNVRGFRNAFFLVPGAK